MRNNKRAVSVGIFIFIGLAIFIAAVLTLGGQKKTFANTITLKAIFNDVSGLQAGNNIWFSGVKVGTVKKIGFTPNADVEVWLDIEEKHRPFIRKNVKAKVGTEGMIGNKIIVLFGGSAAAAPIEENDVVLAQEGINMDDMMSTFQSNNQNLLAITSDFKEISHSLATGQGTIGKLLKEENLLNELQSTLAVLKSASIKASGIATDVAAYTAQLQKEGTLANDLVTDTTIFSSLRATTVQLQQVLNNANSVVADLKQSTEGLQNTNTPAGMLLNDEATAASIKETLKYLQSSTQKLDENMEALQHNFLLRGYFRKKAKEE
jgi:phospholipid/cholesterol/gamma-HCH transport system substrate-binding protein